MHLLVAPVRLLQREEDADHVRRLLAGIVVAAVAAGMKQCDLGFRGQHVGLQAAPGVSSHFVFLFGFSKTNRGVNALRCASDALGAIISSWAAQAIFLRC
jgi:hypothetical protein